MSIAFDSANGGLTVADSTLTFSQTCSGSNRILFVFAAAQTDIVTGVTYNGAAMTLVTKQINDSFNEVYLYYLIAPDTGTNNVVISTSAPTVIYGTACSYTGASQTAQPNAFDSSNQSSSPFTQTVTSTTNNCWAISAIGVQRLWVASTNSTKRTDAASNSLTTCDTNGPQSTGSISMAMTTASPTSDAGIIAAFAPVGVAPVYNSNMLLVF